MNPETLYVVNGRTLMVHSPTPGERCNTDQLKNRERMSFKEALDEGLRRDRFLSYCSWCFPQGVDSVLEQS